MAKYEEKVGTLPEETTLLAAASDSETGLMLELAKFNDMMENAFEENAPHKMCQYIYELSNAFARFYHENKIIAEEDKERQKSWISLICLTKGVLEVCVDLLGMEAPDRM